MFTNDLTTEIFNMSPLLSVMIWDEFSWDTTKNTIVGKYLLVKSINENHYTTHYAERWMKNYEYQ